MDLLGVEIVGAIGGRPERRTINQSGVSIDSRAVQPGELFFALEGERTDGHKYVAQALERGAACAVVHKDVEVPDAYRDRVIRVEDTLRALADSAREYRRRWGGTVVAVTGSNGKTTTREMIHHILSGVMRCKRSPRSFNTNIGVPLTLFLAERHDRAVVVEMGTNAPGEIRELVGIAEPNMAVITDVGPSHLEGLGTIEGVARAKAEVLEGLGESDTAFLNADDRWHSFLAEKHKDKKTVSFGLGPKAPFRGRAVRAVKDGIWFLVGDGVEVCLPVPGRHNARNALAALAVAVELGVPLKTAAARLASFRSPPMRLQMELINGVLVLDDSYNANPGSMRAALEAFRDIEATGRRVAVLGEMRELGDLSAALHEQLAAEVPGFNVNIMWAIGEHGERMARAAAEHGLEGGAFFAGTLDEAAPRICGDLRPGDALLVKGSRSMSMEHLVSRFRETAADATQRRA